MDELHTPQADPMHPRPRWRARSIWPIGAAIAAAIGAATLLFHSNATQTQSEVPPRTGTETQPDSTPTFDPTPVEVQVTKPVRRDIAYTISLPANIAPYYQTTLYAKVSGYLKWIGPDKGDAVKKNQVLAVIDAPEVDDQYRQSVDEYKIRKLTYERLEKVWRESPDVIARQDVDVAEAAYHSAKDVMNQRATLRDYTNVRAPYDGVITARFVDPGALIQVATASSSGALPLFTIMDLSRVRVYANVPQEEAPWIAPGKTSATVTVKELPDRAFEGTITRSTHALDPSTRTLLVEVDLDNRDRALRAGTFAEMVVALRTVPQALVLPPEALVSGVKGKSVFVVADGKAKATPIQTGITDGRWMEVAHGLTGDEDVVVVGKRRLLEGAPVQVSPYALPSGKPSQQKFERRAPGGPTPPPSLPTDAVSSIPPPPGSPVSPVTRGVQP